MPTMPLSATVLARSPEDRSKRKDALAEQADLMSKDMIEQEGLLNHSQAALLLDVTPARLTELVRLGKLRRFDHLGRTYVSMKEVKARRELDIKAGRPARNLMQTLAVGVKAALKTDAAQAKLGGYAGPHVKAKSRRKK